MSYCYQTSLPAYESVKETLGNRQKVVFEFIQSRGDVGATLDEMALVLGWAVNKVCGRRQELELKGLIVDSGILRQTSSGKMAKVWVATKSTRIEYTVPLLEKRSQLCFV